MVAWIHGCRGSWLHGFMVAWIHGCTDSWLHGFMVAGIHGCMDEYTGLHPVYLFVRKFVRSQIRSFNHPFIRSPVHPFTRSPVHSTIRSFNHPFTRSLPRPFIRSPVHSPPSPLPPSPLPHPIIPPARESVYHMPPQSIIIQKRLANRILLTFAVHKNTLLSLRSTWNIFNFDHDRCF